MKYSNVLPLVAALALVAGCSSTHKHGSTAPAASTAPATSSFDTSALVAAFKNADIPSGQLVSSVISALSSKDYSGALSSLQKLAKTPGLTAPQATSVEQLISAVSSRK